MAIGHDWRIGSGSFLQISVISVLALFVGAPPAGAEDRPNTHNMLVFGEQMVFLSHLPMFDSLNEVGTEYRSPHRYQVILEAEFTREQLDSYMKDRQAHSGTRFYTVGPKAFVLSRLFTPELAPRLRSFTATVFRGHLELKSNPVPGLENVPVKIGRVVHARKFDPRVKKPAALEYVLIGRGSERFLAHAIFEPPDFDQIVSVNLVGADLTDRDLEQDIRIVIPDTENVAAKRLRQGQRLEATLQVTSMAPAKVKLEVGNEIYFEEGELLMPPTFDPTEEEKSD